MEPLQDLGDGNAADAVAGASGTVPEGAGEEGLPHADGTAEDDVLLLGQPVQAAASGAGRPGSAVSVGGRDQVQHHLEGERPGAGRIDPVGAVALGEPQEFLRLPQTRLRERAPQQHGDELADGRPRPLGLVDTAIRGAQRIGRPIGRIVGIVGGPAAGRRGL